MERLTRDLAAELRSASRTADPMSKARVTRIDRSSSPWRITLQNGRVMSSVTEDIEVGDLAIFTPGLDPVVIGVAAGGTSAVLVTETNGGGGTPDPGGPTFLPFYNEATWADLSDWTIFDSVGNNGWGLRRPSQISTSTHATEGEVLNIRAQMGTGAEAADLLHGGMRNIARPFRYGRVRFRARVDLDPDEVTSSVVLLWQASNPGAGLQDFEIDVMESFANRDTRDPMQSFHHYDGNSQITQVNHAGVAGNAWHTYELIWLPDLLTVQIDSNAVQNLATQSADIPQEDMTVAIQFDAWSHPSIASPDPANPAHQPSVTGTRVMQVAWLTIETLAP